MPGQVELKYRKGQLAQYQKDILSLDVCPLFLQHIFASYEETEIASVKTDGYCPLVSMESFRGQDALQIMISLLGAMMDAENHCFFVGEYRVDSSVICVDHRCMNARIVFIPRTYSNQVAIYQDLMEILDYMKKRTIPGEEIYVQEGIDYIARGCGDLTMIRQRLELIRQKACATCSRT